ncbi:MAG TPA: hypothetical protein VKF40_11945 [Burkholderiales bacterium]|nr:hypothetical protein [Burkholderiales bacterium]
MKKGSGDGRRLMFSLAGLAFLASGMAACGGSNINGNNGNGNNGNGNDAGNRDGDSNDAGSRDGAPDASPPDACVADLQSDPQNCGSCGHDCQGSACVAGACQPVVLASGLLVPSSLAVDQATVYWTTYGHADAWNGATGDGSVMSVPRSGGTPLTIASGQRGPHTLQIDATYAYWANTGDYSMQAPFAYENGAVMKSPLNGGTPVVIATARLPQRLVLDTTSIYWTNWGTQTWSGSAWVYNNDGSVMTAPLGGGAATMLSSGQPAYGIVVDPTNFYWAAESMATTGPNASDYSIMKMPRGGAPAALVSGQHNLAALRMSSSDLFWLDGGTFDASGHIALPDGAILTLPTSGGNPVRLASNQAGPWDIAVDSGAVYWTDAGLTRQSGTVMKLPPGQQTPIVLATQQDRPSSLVVDDRAVFWLNSSSANNVADGSVMKLAK